MISTSTLSRNDVEFTPSSSLVYGNCITPYYRKSLTFISNYFEDVAKYTEVNRDIILVK